MTGDTTAYYCVLVYRDHAGFHAEVANYKTLFYDTAKKEFDRQCAVWKNDQTVKIELRQLTQTLLEERL